MSTNATSKRESRRRKILERGPDRLALITGRAHTCPSESDSSQPLNPSPPYLPNQITAASSNGDDEVFSSLLPNDGPVTDADWGVSDLEPSLHTRETSIETSRPLASDGGSNASLASSTDHESASVTVQLTCSNGFVTPSQISSAITASERSRLFCSVTMAVFIILSYLGFPLLGSNVIKSIISFRPLYLVLLTNLTLVLVRFMFNNQRGVRRTSGRECNTPSTSKDDWTYQAGRALEVGLMMQKAIEALLMDCSIYALIIVAGFSFVQ